MKPRSLILNGEAHIRRWTLPRGYWVRFIYGGSRNMPFFPFIAVQITHPMDVYHASMYRVPHCEGDILYTTRAYKYIRTSRFAKYVHDEKRRWNRKRI